MTYQQLGLFDHLTHRANLKHTRFGWLRLTPAYSVHLVEEILKTQLTPEMVVLDPFCGTGTTALVCARKGIRAETTDINPFLIWLTITKTQSYNEQVLQDFKHASTIIRETIIDSHTIEVWTPSIHQIEKWWNQETLLVLGNLMQLIHSLANEVPPQVLDLLKVAFCRVMINHSSASFNHQSMSFKKGTNGSIFKATEDVMMSWQSAEEDIYSAARSKILRQPKVLLCDARHLTNTLPQNYYTCVITSPPYPNRMSYIRELRPYMYWLGYLANGREAGELDWEAIGGTWGIATSNAGKWIPPINRNIPYHQFKNILEKITEQSDILARYVHKYFYDMVDHIDNLFLVTRPGATINYIVGNSKFYDVILPVEEIFASLFEQAGFVDIEVKPIRKRTSKKELYEYIVTSKKP